MWGWGWFAMKPLPPHIPPTSSHALLPAFREQKVPLHSPPCLIRVQYMFDGVAIEAAGLRLPLPFPFRAGGWTEAVYVDGTHRLMYNSLGDTLLFVREG